ncbi:hypothetical protein VNO77_33823 [Canavalia gladiata]|uniref:Pectinesterase inhibitor domain-containing protein n=1 Tax=Canavalia gladiata TaxID=3824 RepID=A0AAN9KE26_CANGL
MARSACCLVLISLCLSIVLEPALAENLPNGSSTKHLAPEATPLASDVPTQQDLVKKLCQETRKSKLCTKIVQGDKETLRRMNPIIVAKVSIDLATTMASNVGAYMSNELKKNHVNVVSRGCVEECKLGYESVVEELNIAYLNFENKPQKAILSLNTVDKKVELCANSLKLASSQGELSTIVETNKVILGLVQLAQNVSKSPAH